jgi:hypothetical protein
MKYSQIKTSRNLLIKQLLSSVIIVIISISVIIPIGG